MIKLFLLLPLSCLSVSLNTIVSKTTEGLSTELLSGITKYAIKLDFALENRAKNSWRPDRFSSNPQGTSTEIKTYITNINKLINQCASDLDQILTAANASVVELRRNIIQLVNGYNFDPNVTLKDEQYYNAGYVNTYIDKNDEDDRYVLMRLQIASMVKNKCYGMGMMNVSFEKSTVHVPFNVYARKDDVIMGAVLSDGLDQERAFNDTTYIYNRTVIGLSKFFL